MIRNLTRATAIIAVLGLGLAACEKQLEVSNPNSGDTQKVLATPTDAENLVAGYFKRWSTGLYGSITVVDGMTSVMSLMNFSSLANNCLNGRLPFAGADNFNTAGNVCTAEQLRIYSIENEVQRVASNFLVKADSLDLGSTARKSRDQAFAEFLRGISLGYIAMFYDSSAVVSPTMDQSAANCVPDPFTQVCRGALRGYKEVSDSAMAAFARAITYTNAPVTGGNGFPIPSTWIPSNTNYTAPEFVKLIRSYRARIRANIARTPAERAAVDWTSVIADAQNGITSDELVTTSNSTTSGSGMINSWRAQYDGAGLWHQMPPFIIGMADTSGAYNAWLSTPLTSRGTGNVGFIMATPDNRFPQGVGRAAQQADFAISSCAVAATVCKRYFVNRPAGSDQFAGAGWGWSNYDFARFHSWTTKGDGGTGQLGNTIYFAKTELDMLQAEGLYRQGNYAAAGALVNLSRQANGKLPAITVFDAVTPVPGGNACVPKVPVGPNFTTAACGNLFEALKYEKRIETAYTVIGPWYFDGRGWGDLPQGTALFWATPNEDILARGKAQASLYGVGVGVGDAPNSSAAKGTYGW